MGERWGGKQYVRKRKQWRRKLSAKMMKGEAREAGESGRKTERRGGERERRRNGRGESKLI